MQVTGISNNYYQPNFSSWHREVFKVSGGVEKLVHRNNTSAYRDSDWWIGFGKFIIDFFNDCKHVNVYDWGCSNGAEPTTFVMHMFSNFPQSAQKFTPVFAKDYDREAIKMAKKHVLPLDFWEVHRINKFTGGKFLEFFRTLPIYYTDMFLKNERELVSYYRKNNVGGKLSKTFDAKINEEYTKYIEYKVSNILTDYDKIQPSESLVMARNFLPYLGGDIKVYELIENLSRQMRKKSVFATGGFDFEEIIPLEHHLKRCGFKKSPVYGVFYKP